MILIPAVGVWLSPVVVWFIVRRCKFSRLIAVVLLVLSDYLISRVLGFMGVGVYYPVFLLNGFITHLILGGIIWYALLAIAKDVHPIWQVVIVGLMWLSVAIRCVVYFLDGAYNEVLIAGLAVPDIFLAFVLGVFTFSVGFFFLKRLPLD